MKAVLRGLKAESQGRKGTINSMTHFHRRKVENISNQGVDILIIPCGSPRIILPLGVLCLIQLNCQGWGSRWRNQFSRIKIIRMIWNHFVKGDYLRFPCICTFEPSWAIFFFFFLSGTPTHALLLTHACPYPAELQPRSHGPLFYNHIM